MLERQKVGTHRVPGDRILALHSFDEMAFGVIVRTDDVVVRKFVFEAVRCHGNARR